MDNIELPSHSDSPLPVEVGYPPVAEDTSFPLFENLWYPHLGQMTWKGTLIPFKTHNETVATRFLTRVKSQHIPGEQVYNEIQEVQLIHKKNCNMCQAKDLICFLKVLLICFSKICFLLCFLNPEESVRMDFKGIKLMRIVYILDRIVYILDYPLGTRQG